MRHRRHAQHVDREFIRALQQLRIVTALKSRGRDNRKIGLARTAARHFRNIIATRAKNRAVVSNGELISVMRFSHKATIRLASPM